MGWKALPDWATEFIEKQPNTVGIKKLKIEIGGSLMTFFRPLAREWANNIPIIYLTLELCIEEGGHTLDEINVFLKSDSLWTWFDAGETSW